MKTAHKAITAAVAAALAGSAFVGWGLPALDAPAHAAAAVVTYAEPNPVDVLRAMHVPLAPGETAGRVDIDGDRYAAGQFTSGEQVTVFAYADQAAEDASVARNPSNDVNKQLVGRLFTVTVTGVDDGNGIVFPEPVATLAAESGAVAG